MSSALEFIPVKGLTLMQMSKKRRHRGHRVAFWNFVHIISDNLISNPHEVVELYVSGYKRLVRLSKL